jgi:hypothetical protein
MEWPQTKFGKHKEQGKVDLNSKHGFQVFIWAVQVAVRLVNAWETPERCMPLHPFLPHLF